MIATKGGLAPDLTPLLGGAAAAGSSDVSSLLTALYTSPIALTPSAVISGSVHSNLLINVLTSSSTCR